MVLPYENMDYTDSEILTRLSELTDVAITNATNGQVIQYNDVNEEWENATIPSGVTSLPQLTDVTITNVANEQILIYNDSNETWENTTPTYLDGANLPDNFLIKSVNNQSVTSQLYSTTTTTTNQLEFLVPTDPIFSVVSGVIQNTTNALGTSKRMNLATGYIANTRGLTITESGRVGIGILNPEEDLQIDGKLRIDDANTQTLTFHNTQGGQIKEHGRIELTDNGGGADLLFYTRPSGGNEPTEKLRIDKNGAVGIGGANYGTTGQVLTSNGSGSAISWSSPSGGLPNGTNQSQGLHWNNTTSQWEITGDGKLAFGNDAGEINQGLEAIAIGTNAGKTNQGTYAVALGAGAGFTGQLSEAIAIGNNSGLNDQGERSIAIGLLSGAATQSTESVAIGYFAGNSQQGIKSISIGQGAGKISQNTKSVAIGNDAAGASQGSEAIAIGNNAGYGGQGNFSIAIGDRASTSSQGTNCVSIGQLCGDTSQQTKSVAIGSSAGKTGQGTKSVAIGNDAGGASQGTEAIAIGNNTGYGAQGNFAIAIGDRAGASSQGSSSIAIGKLAGVSSQAANSTIINSTGLQLDAAATGFYVAPIRSGVETNTLCYNTSSKEIRYEPDPARTHYNEKTMAGQVTTEFFSINRDVVRSLVLEVRIVTGSGNGYTSLYHTRTGAYFTTTEIFVRNTEVIANTSFTGGGSAHVIQITENPQNAQLDINVISNTAATNTVAVYLNVFSNNGSPPVIII